MLGIDRLVDRARSALLWGQAARHYLRLKYSDEESIDMLAAAAMTWRAYFSSLGMDFGKILQLAADPKFVADIEQAMVGLNTSGRTLVAGSLEIWQQTARAVLRPELRPMVKRMWRELERAGPEAFTIAKELCQELGLVFSHALLNRPRGFEDKHLG